MMQSDIKLVETTTICRAGGLADRLAAARAPAAASLEGAELLLLLRRRRRCGMLSPVDKNALSLPTHAAVRPVALQGCYFCAAGKPPRRLRLLAARPANRRASLTIRCANSRRVASRLAGSAVDEAAAAAAEALLASSDGASCAPLDGFQDPVRPRSARASMRLERERERKRERER